MANEVNFYAGADYGFDPSYGKEYSINFSSGYSIPAGHFGTPTDPRLANQLDAVAKKISTGQKVIEVSGVSPEVLDYIPDQHLTEINRLKKLTGVDLTFHGPLVEPTGFSRQGWSENSREQVEREVWSAIKRSHRLDPTGNIVVTFHSSNGIPDPIQKIKTEVIDPVTKEKKMMEQVTEMYVVDENSGSLDRIPFKQDYFKSQDNIVNVKDQEKLMVKFIEEKNKEVWYRQLQNLSFHANSGYRIIRNALPDKGEKEESEVLDAYSDYTLGGKQKENLEKLPKDLKDIGKSQIYEIGHGEYYLRDAYQDLKKLFNQAYETAKLNGSSNDVEKLDEYRKELKEKIKYLESRDPKEFLKFAEEIERGVQVLGSIVPPQTFKPLRDFAIEKSAKTFANAAFNAYQEFKDTAPIISIENPPAGSGLTRAEDLNGLVEKSRKILQNKLTEEGLSKSEAENQAKKLIGVTWDVGHINMMRKFGYTEKDIIEQTKKVAQNVKHIHLSDNFGMEHTELPMGMGNVPVAPMLEAIKKYNEQAKKIVETGGWYQHFKTTPMLETLRAFGSPVYSMKMSPYWNQLANSSGGYFSGYGRILPDTHFSLYGSGFSNMPPELGGQMAGRSRASGAPIE